MAELYPARNNLQGNTTDTRKQRLEIEIDERELAKQIEKKIDIAMTKALKNINRK